MIKIESLCKSFGKQKALDNIRLTIESREIHVLLGSSGSGKSTLLRIIMGILASDSGQVYMDDEPILPENQRTVSQRIGYVPQDGGLFPHMTALRNVTLVAQLKGWPESKISNRVDELRNLVGLEESLFRLYPRQLSGGQRQRVSIMRAAFLDPLFMIFDEPLGALDPIIRADLQTELKRIFREMKKTVLLVTHDVGEAAYFGDRITLMHQGRIIQSGSMRELLHHPASEFVSHFINSQRTLSDLRSE